MIRAYYLHFSIFTAFCQEFDIWRAHHTTPHTADARDPYADTLRAQSAHKINNKYK